MNLRSALLQARRRLEDAGVPEAALEAEVLLRHAIAAATSAPVVAPFRPPTGPSPSGFAAIAVNKIDLAVGEQHAAPLRDTPIAVTRAYLFSHLDDDLSPSTAKRYEAALSRRLAREPTAYILGHREFYNLDLLVTPATLIPRPETEIVVEASIRLCASSWPADARPGSHPEPVEARASHRSDDESSGPPRRSVSPSPLRGVPSRVEGERVPGGEVVIADIGTGCGAIAIALAVALPQASLYATDISSDALAVARENAKRHGVDRRIAFRRGDLLGPVPSYLDLIVANLPYVNEKDMLGLAPELREHEPHLALVAGPDGLSLIRRLLHQAPRYLRPGGAVCLEFGYGQSQAVMFLARAALPAASVSLRHDLTGQPRVLIAQP